MKRLASKYDNSLIEEACQRVLELTSIPTVKNITLLIKNNKVKAANESAFPKLKNKSTDNSYAFIRGYEYYRKDGDSK